MEVTDEHIDGRDKTGRMGQDTTGRTDEMGWNETGRDRTRRDGRGGTNGRTEQNATERAGGDRTDRMDGTG